MEAGQDKFKAFFFVGAINAGCYHSLFFLHLIGMFPQILGNIPIIYNIVWLRYRELFGGFHFSKSLVVDFLSFGSSALR